MKQFVARATSRSAVAVDHRIVRPDGEIRWWRTNVTRIDTDEGPALLGQAVDHTADRRRDVLNQSIDPLTGLLTRDRLIATLEDHVFSHAVSDEHPIAVLVADIVDFKGVNERLGPEVADQVLRRVGATIRASLPADADVARIGPDVFAVAALRHRRRRGRQRRGAHRSSPRRGRPERHDGRQPDLRAHRCRRRDAPRQQSLDDLLQRAEGASRSDEGSATGATSATGTGTPGAGRALVGRHRRSPRAGRRRSKRRSRPDTSSPSPSRSCRSAPAKPLRRFELLVRLEMPGGQLLALPRFDQLAQRMGYGPVVDHWMIDRALELLAASNDLELEVNIAPSSLSDPGFVAELAKRIEKLDGVSERLLLALTEQSVLDDVTQALRFSDEARALGVRIVLDEYVAAQGGGSYLESLGISRVKLSGRLIRAAVNGTSERQMIAELAKTAHEHGSRSRHRSSAIRT